MNLILNRHKTHPSHDGNNSKAPKSVRKVRGRFLKRIGLFLAAALCVAMMNTSALGQVVAWQFGSPASTGDEATFNATTNNANLNTSTLSRGSDISASPLARAFSSSNYIASGTKADAIANNEYMEFAVSAVSGFKVSLSTLDARLRRSSSGPNAYIWRYSIDGNNFTDIGSDISFTSTADGVTQTQIDLSGISALQNVQSGTTITMRIYAWGATAAAGTFAIGRFGAGVTTNSLAIGGTVAAIPVITTSVNSLPDFGNVTVGSSSTEQNYTVSGSNLTDDITVNAPIDFEVSKVGSGVDFGPSVILIQAGGLVNAQTVYVRFSPGSAGVKAGNITHSSTGATTQNVAVSGTGVAAPADVVFNASGDLPAGTYHDVTINNCGTFVNMTGNVVITGTLTINNCAHLQTNNFIVSGSGSFVLADGGWLHIGDVNGITSGTTLSGNIQVTGGRNYNSSGNGNFVYTGNAIQAAGNGLPASVTDLLIANTGPSGDNTVTGNTGQVVTGLLEIVDGVYVSASDYHNVIIDAGGTLSLNASITVSGNWTNHGGFSANGFSVTFDGTTNQSIGGASATTFAALVINNTGAVNSNIVTLANETTVTTDLNISAGIFDQGTAPSSNLATNTVTVASGATFRNLGTGDLTLSGNVSNSGTINFNANGTPCGDPDDILIRSSLTGTQRSWSGTGTINMTDVDVKDQGGTAPITVRSGTNNGNNGLNWIFIANCAGGTYTWNGTTLADWSVGTNWTPTRVVAHPSDVMVFDGSITPAPQVSNVPTETIAALRIINGAAVTLSTNGANTLTIDGATGSDLTVPALSQLTLAGANGLTISVAAGSTATIGGLVLFQDGPHSLLGNSSDAISFQSGAICTTAPGTYNDHPFGTGGGGDGTACSVTFASGSNYFHNAGQSPFGAAANPSVAVFQTGSTANWLTSSGFQGSGRTYADLVIGNPSTPTTVSDSGEGNFQFDNLTVTSTGAANSSLTFTGSGANAITIQGNITSNGVGTGSTLPDVILTPGSGGITINKSGTATFGNDGSNARAIDFEGNANVTNGTTLALSRVLLLGFSNPHQRTLTVDATGNISGGSSGYVVGSLKKVSVPNGTFIFPVGTAGAYSPLDLANASGGGDLTVAARTPEQTQLAAATSLHRYWTLTEGGAGITADLTFHYLQGDVFGTESNYQVVVVDGTPTYYPETCPGVCVDEATNTLRKDGVSTFSDWSASEPAAPTAVKLTGFAAAQDGNAVTLAWQSGYEAHNLGYYVYREQNGKRTQITPSIVAGSALTIGGHTVLTAGHSYTWYDRLPAGSTDATYWLEDVDLNGTRTLHGPITPFIVRSSRKEPTGARSRLLNELNSGAPPSGVLFDGWPSAGAKQSNDVRQTSVCRGELKASGCTLLQAKAHQTQIAQQSDIAGTTGVKLEISKAGWYRVTQPELVAAGLDANANASQLQLFANGQEVPIKVSGNGVQFTSSDHLEFYGHGINSPTDAAQTYYLLEGNSAGQRIAVINNGPVPPPSGPQNYNYTVARKDRLIYYAAFLNGDAENIFGQIITSSPTSLTLPVNHRDIAAGGDAQLQVSLVGVSFQDHQVQLKLNGVDVGTIDFGMAGQPNQMFIVPASLLQEGENTVQLTALGGSSDVSLADTVRLTYAHAYTADNDALSISINNGNTTRVDGFTNVKVRAVDITDPNNIQELTPVVTEQPDGTFAADLQIAAASPEQPHTLLLFADGQAAHPDSIKHNAASAWKANTNAADYLIITTHDFISNVQPLAQFRQTQGLSANVIDVEDLYDEFSFGIHSPQAIHDFLQTASSTWTIKPRYVLLMGDASFDPKNYLGQGNTDLVPTKLFDTALMETASDDWLADFNSDGVADLAIGRLPVRTSADANLMVNKIIGFENMPANPQRLAVFVADKDFETPSSAIQGVLPASMPKQTINRSSASDSAIHNQILDSINQGPLLVNYLGHGSNGVWTGARLLSNPDAPSLTNTNGLSFFVMMTCLNGYFQDAYNDSLSEALLRTSGGAVAVWASTGMTEPSGQSIVDMELYRQLFNGQSPRLGDAVRAAKATTSDSDIRRTWTLFGDPAMRLVSLAPTATNGSVSGTITDSHGAPLAGTTITLSGAQTRRTITASNGYYRFDNLDTNGFYTVTPSRANYTLSPASRSFSLVGMNTEASFTAAANAATINLLDDTDYFVRQHYLDFLGREPDESGFNYWSDQIRSCGSDPSCTEARRINTSAAFFLSIEFQQSGYLVYRTYKSAYGNMTDAPVPLKLNEFLPDTGEIGQGVVVNQEGWEQLLENNKQAFMSEFVKRTRFTSAHPTTLTPAEFVDRLFANAGVTASGSERAEAVGEFGSATTTSNLAARARVLRRVGENATLAQKEMNRAFVLMQYFGYLRRNPSDAPEATLDYGGYNFWLNKLNTFNGNFVSAEMVRAFLVSGEYRKRFSSQ